ncbi:hypothetical protein JOQ06_004173 [Pogonophryne albipinna]|uniref:Uncharacterized protein n=1 Tax=Pogonophryne albipinna TaxID=1090488 RepID=A0AAD6A4L4_9TELE|nr:hypothetical protein JOQ06_004173 [Pogonophryne albipinna]
MPAVSLKPSGPRRSFAVQDSEGDEHLLSWEGESPTVRLASNIPVSCTKYLLRINPHCPLRDSAVFSGLSYRFSRCQKERGVSVLLQGTGGVPAAAVAVQPLPPAKGLSFVQVGQGQPFHYNIPEVPGPSGTVTAATTSSDPHRRRVSAPGVRQRTPGAAELLLDQA